jgi:two-component system cell cycle sensor histidine kinase/response regulator CckA
MNQQRLVMLGRIAAGVAHDLNNYLCIVDLALDALERTSPHGSARRLPLHEAQEAIRGAKQLTNGLLDYARGGAPKMQRVDLPALIDYVLVLFRRMIPENVVVEVHSTADPIYIRGVPADLEQLVLNIVLNACDAMPHGGVLSLRVQARGERGVTFEATDTGSGVCEAIRTASGPTSPSSKHEGATSGLGLGIVRAVAERHEAHLEIGPYDGGGTRIAVTFADYSETVAFAYP